MTSQDVALDPAALDSWSGVEVCPNVLKVVIDNAAYELHCEEDAGHEPPHSATVLWGASTQAQEAQR